MAGTHSGSVEVCNWESKDLDSVSLFSLLLSELQLLMFLPPVLSACLDLCKL